MSLVGIVDLGSNSVRLVVYELKKNAKAELEAGSADTKNGKDDDSAKGGAKKPFRTLMDKKKMAGLSAYVVNGKLTKEGIQEAIDAASSLMRSANNIGCDDIHLFATAVIRNCKNSKQAAKEISKAVDAKIDVLSDEEEAHLGFIGATFDNPIEQGTLIDIGGGSTELTEIRKGKDVRDLSLPQGSVSSYADYVSLILPQPAEEVAVREAFLEKLSSVGNLDDFRNEHLYGIGGSVRAIHKLYAAAFSDNNRLNTLELYQIEALQNLLANQPSTFAHAATKAVPERMHTVGPGLIIARTLMEHLGATSLTVCKHGIREGYLLERVIGI